ncbi:tenm3 [Symbiodinium sp. CCMP2592]|nr:tenm3 [Symbiodinium sp. CCMP2592]
MTTIPKTEVEAFVVLYARCNDIGELLSDEAQMTVVGSCRQQSWIRREEECGLYSLVHLTREEVLTVRKRLGRTRTWDITRAGQEPDEFIIPPPEDPTDMNPVHDQLQSLQFVSVAAVLGQDVLMQVAEAFSTTSDVPEVPETTITRLSCGVNLQGDQVCICEDGWYGPQCDQLCNCTGAGIAGCNEGPEGDGSCYCKPGYVGETCDRCGEYYYNLQNGCAIYCHPDDRCSGNGECTTDPVTHLINGCACYESWDGEDCRQCAQNYYPSRVCNVYCDKNTTCSGHGECSDFGTCVCDAGRRGANCDQCEQDYYPPGECSRRCFIGLNCVQGECDADGYCQCKPNWYGETCSVSCPRCSLEGSWGCNEGREGDGTCSCKTGWDGPVCSDPAEYIETEWSTCEGTCGGFPGVRSRIVRCYNSRSKAILPDERCVGEKPLEQEACTTPLCSCSVPPPILHSDYDKTVGVCSFLQNDRTCRAICDDGYARSGEYKCVASRYVQQPICLPLGDAAHVKEALFSYVTLAGIDLVAVANLTWWYGSISPSLQQVLAAALVPIPGYQVLPEQVTLRAWREVARALQGPVSSDTGAPRVTSLLTLVEASSGYSPQVCRKALVFRLYRKALLVLLETSGANAVQQGKGRKVSKSMKGGCHRESRC